MSRSPDAEPLSARQPPEQQRGEPAEPDRGEPAEADRGEPAESDRGEPAESDRGEPARGAPPASMLAGEGPTVSEQLEGWLQAEGDKTLGGLIEFFGSKGFALVFVLLLGVPALPLPTGGATHVFEVIAVLVALQLIAGREAIWLPQRWRAIELAGGRRERFIAGLMKLIRRLERFSRPRFRFIFNHRLSNIVFGVLVIAGSAGAFFAPPFTGLDTLPALGVVLLSLGVLLEDIIVVAVAVVVGAVGVVLEIALGSAAVHGVGSLL